MRSQHAHSHKEDLMTLKIHGIVIVSSGEPLQTLDAGNLESFVFDFVSAGQDQQPHVAIGSDDRLEFVRHSLQPLLLVVQAVYPEKFAPVE
ncbi:hypothetical protein BH09PAT2_BH09PAT2_07660 [soil metagenome]